MAEYITLTEFRKRLGGLSESSAKNAWKKGRLIGERTDTTPNAPLRLDWIASVKLFCEDSTTYKIQGDSIINITTDDVLWKFKPGELTTNTFLQRKVPLNKIDNQKEAKPNIQDLINQREYEHLQEFAKIGLQVFDDKGRPKSITTLAREQEALFKAKRSQLDYEKELQKVVSVEVVQRLVANLAADTCKAILSVPDRIAPVLSTMDDIHKIHNYLTEELTFALDELSRTLEDMFNHDEREESNADYENGDDDQFSDDEFDRYGEDQGTTKE